MVDRAGLRGIRPLGDQRTPAGVSARNTEGQDFGRILKQKLESEIKFSRHAQERLGNRPLGQAQVTRLQGAVERAASKGARESLVLMDDLALVVSIPNRTVITAVSKTRMNDQVFTNIDSAVVVRDGAGPSSGGPSRGLTEAAQTGRPYNMKEVERA